MSEREYEIRPVGVDYICDSCNIGLMEPFGPVLISNPPQYVCRCNYCQEMATLSTNYPVVRWKLVQ